MKSTGALPIPALVINLFVAATSVLKDSKKEEWVSISSALLFYFSW